MHPLPLVSWTRSGRHLTHLDTDANQILKIHEVSSGRSLNLSQVGSRAVVSMVLSPHQGMSLETKRHIQRVSHTSSRWHEGEGRDLICLQLSFRNPSNDTKSYES